MPTPIKTAVIPVAGLGSRFLPITKAAPKEMLPIVDTPIIQFAVTEAINAGIEKIVFITSSTKQAIENYFDTNYELEKRLEAAGKDAALAEVRNLVPNNVTLIYLRQSSPKGLGHAVLTAQGAVGREPFAILLPDDIVETPSGSCVSNMIEMYNSTGSSVIATETVEQARISSYGITDSSADSNGHLALQQIVEKPKPEDAPSNNAVVGRYVFTPAIFDHIKKTAAGVGGEIQLTDAIASLLQEEAIYTYPLQGIRHDCGDKLGHLKANITYALKRSDLATDLKGFLETILAKETT